MSHAHTNQCHHDVGSSPSSTEIISALKAFIHAPTWGATYHVLEAQQAILLADATLALLHMAIDRLKGSNNAAGEAFLEQYLHLLEDAHKHGIVAAWQSFEQQREQEIMAKMIAHVQDELEIDTLLRSLIRRTLLDDELNHQKDELPRALPSDVLEHVYPLSQHCAAPYFKVVDILEHHQHLLEQVYAWSEAITKQILEEMDNT